LRTQVVPNFKSNLEIFRLLFFFVEQGDSDLANRLCKEGR
jgi:hypothetical protein